MAAWCSLAMRFFSSSSAMKAFMSEAICFLEMAPTSSQKHYFVKPGDGSKAKASFEHMTVPSGFPGK